MSSPPPCCTATTAAGATAAGDEEVSVLSTPVCLDDIQTVWQFERLEKLGGPDELSKKWRCGFCGMTLRGWNATKAMNHLVSDRT